VNRDNIIESYNLRYAILYLNNLFDFPYKHPFEVILFGLTSSAAIVDDYNYLMISIPIVISDNIEEEAKYFDDIFDKFLDYDKKYVDIPIKKIFDGVNTKFVYFNQNEEAEYNSSLDKNFNFFLFKNPVKISKSNLKKLREYKTNIYANSKGNLVSEGRFINTQRIGEIKNMNSKEGDDSSFNINNEKDEISEIAISPDKLYRNFDLEKQNEEIIKLKNLQASDSMKDFYSLDLQLCNRNYTILNSTHSTNTTLGINEKINETVEEKHCNKTKLASEKKTDNYNMSKINMI